MCRDQGAFILAAFGVAVGWHHQHQGSGRKCQTFPGPGMLRQNVHKVPEHYIAVRDTAALLWVAFDSLAVWWMCPSRLGVYVLHPCDITSHHDE